MNYKKFHIIALFFVFAWTVSADNSIFSVMDYGAKGDGQTNDTKAIQATIDNVAAKGGGIVSFPAGKYVSGTIVLKDYIVLRFETGSIMQGSLNLKDYPDDLGVCYLTSPYVWLAPLIYAEDVRYIGIEGNGIIDGRGTRENFPPFPRENERPGLIRFKDCKFVNVENVTMRNPACWTFHLLNCEDVVVRDIRLNSNANRNNDGIDVNGGKRILITGCNINSEDDAIVLKSFSRETISDIVISDCILTSTCSAIKIGTETVGNFENITISNCAIYGSRGINLFSVDGSNINNVTISNISMRNSKSAIQIRLGERMRPYNMVKDELPAHAGKLRNIMISNVQAVIGEDVPSTGMDNSQNFISGIPGYKIENVTLSNIRIMLFGNGEVKQAQREIPEEIKAYPKSEMFGDLPAYGFYVRHVDGIKMDGVNLEVLNPDYRPALVFDDVCDIDVTDCTLEGYQSGEPVISLVNVENAIFRNNNLKGRNENFIGISGKKSKDIILKDNFLKNTKNTCQLSGEVKKEIVTEIGTIR